MTNQHSIKPGYMIVSKQFFSSLLVLLCVLSLTFNKTYAQDGEKPGNSSFTFAISPNNLSVYSVPPVGFIADFGINKWGAFGIYAGYGRIFGLNEINVGGRLTAQVFAILNEFLDSPINVPGLKPYVGYASGYNAFIDNELLGGYSGSPVIGTRYYPVDGIGFLIEIGETFNGRTGLNVGLSLGGKQ